MLMFPDVRDICPPYLLAWMLAVLVGVQIWWMKCERKEAYDLFPPETFRKFCFASPISEPFDILNSSEGLESSHIGYESVSNCRRSSHCSSQGRDNSDTEFQTWPP